MTRYILTHDVGTSSDKAALITLQGEVARNTSRSYSIFCPKPGYQEQNPLDWWKAFCECTKELLEGLHPNAVIGVSLTGQMMGCIPIDREGNPVCPGIIWADTRAMAESLEIEQIIGAKRYIDITGLRASPNGSIAKITWLKKNRPDLYAKADCFLSAKDYISLRLTSVKATDEENATYMYCFDRKKNKWSEEIMETVGVKASLLPEVIPGAELVGRVTHAASVECGLTEGTPVIMATGDGGAVTLGTATLRQGDVYASLGTSSWVCAVTDPQKQDPDGKVAKINYLKEARDTGAMQAGGYSFNWVRQLLTCDSSRKDAAFLNELAENSKSGANGVLYLPYLLGERSPYWDAELRGGFLGLNGNTSRGDLIRAVMEGVTTHLSIIFKHICRVNELQTVKSLKLVGGGANSKLWRSIFADSFGIPVTVLSQAEHVGTLGIAVFAGVGLKVFDGFDVIKQFQKVEDITYPNPENTEKYETLRSVQMHAKEALDQVKKEIVGLY